MTERYALKGVNDDASECCVCGKIDLKRVMWLVELNRDGEEIGNPFHCGTTCGAHLLGYTHGKLRTKVKNYAAEVARRRRGMKQMHPSSKRANELIKELNNLGLRGIARWEHPLMAEVLSLENEAKEWAAAQEILIEL